MQKFSTLVLFIIIMISFYYYYYYFIIIIIIIIIIISYCYLYIYIICIGGTHTCMINMFMVQDNNYNYYNAINLCMHVLFLFIF